MRLVARLAGLTIALIAVAGCGQTATSPATGGGASAAAASIAPSAGSSGTIALADFKILPAEVSVPAEFVLSVSNAGPTPHNLTIRDEAGAVAHATAEIGQGSSAMLSGRLEPGRYITFCSLPGHESLGMRALLIVGA